MSDSIHLDGNSMGGLLFELFGQEMTARLGCCGVCGAVRSLAEVHVYRDAPGDVMRCPSCDSVLAVVVHGVARLRGHGRVVAVDRIRGVERLEHATRTFRPSRDRRFGRFPSRSGRGD